MIVHDGQGWEVWRNGVRTRMRVGAPLGSRQLCIFEQVCDPGVGAPTHAHAVEEVLEVVSGTAEVWCGEGRVAVGPNQSVLVPAGVLHGFRNTGSGALHVRATLASPGFEATYEGGGEAPRRWPVPE